MLPFVRQLVKNEISPGLASGIQVKAGKVTHRHLAHDTGRAYSAL